MEYCMAARALKPSLRRELSAKSTQQAFFEDFLGSNSNNGVVSSEDFSVDCFFDFSNGEFKDSYMQQELEEEEEEGDEEEKDSVSVSSQDRADDDNNSNLSHFSDSVLINELSLPVDQLAELEWVSQIVDDSSLEFPVLLYPLETENHAMNRFQPQPEPVFLPKPSCIFPFKIPAKPRTKRSRPTVRTWSGSSITDSSSSLSSSSTTSSGSTLFVFNNSVQIIESLPTEPPAKRPKNKQAVQTGSLTGSTQFQRRCSHCHVQKTPQWRTGPLGAKTLCNACGVRYKSGRLFPEYRPACSPTFSEDVHSNSHRKVLEIRKRKEMAGPESGLNQMVSSF